MSRKVLAMTAIAVFAAGCADYETARSEEQLIREPLTPQQINKRINTTLQKSILYNWKDASTYLLWSAVVQGNNVVAIGYGNDAADIERNVANAKIKSDILNVIEQFEGKLTVISDDPILTTMDVEIRKQETIAALRKLRFIRYIEPADYRYTDYETNLVTYSGVSSGSGCGYESVSLLSQDFTTIQPNARAGWTLYHHNIPTAWNLSTGAGVTIGIVDTGTSPQQSLLGNAFNDGFSQGRTIQKFGTFVDSAWPWSTGTDGVNDLCGHGTSMAAAAAAPRNDNGMPVGVAYNSNLITYRAAANVVLDSYHEQNGVKNAFTALGNNNSVRIISMSMGHVFSVGKISDGVKYAFNRGKLIFCAGGTSTSFTNFVGVIFPASMPEAIAVTGVKDGASYQKCDVCHSGSKIEFTVAMQRNANGSTAPVLSYYDNQTDYVGGSSVATATTAGIAALVWARYPTWTRQQVLDRMRQASHFFPNKNGQFGYGNINAAQAVQ